MRARQQLQRFFVDPTSIVNNLVKFSDGISHQISQVLRLNVTDDQVIVLDGSGAAYLARLNGKLGRNVTAQIVEKLAIDSDELTDITLCFSLTKREKVEWILQKCTEIGVSRFQPFVSERSVSRSENMDEKRKTRWESIIREAAEQSECSKLPILMEVISLDEVLDKTTSEAHKLIAYEGTDSAHTLHQLTLKREPVVLMIGPEGGFSDEEAARAISAGFQPFSLGKRILRMETACIVASALVIDRLGIIAEGCD